MHILNQAFLNICTKLEPYREEVVFESWVKRITINACIDEYRRNKRRSEQTQSLDDAEMNGASVAIDLNLGDLELNAASLREIIRKLPETSMQVFNLAVLDGYPYEEVSKMLEMSEATCRWHVHHARKKLQEMIRREEHDMKNVAT